MSKKTTLYCRFCNTKWEHNLDGSYPCGPCPTCCPNCGNSCCPECGGEMGRSIDGDEMDDYTSGGCHDCDYTCCGGCI